MNENPISEALDLLSLHALELQLTSKARGDAGAEFVWHEIREMLRSLAMFKRSPLLDALNDRVSQNPNGSDYYYAKIAATAAVFVVMKAQSWSRARACKVVGRLTGFNALVLEKKMGLPTGPLDMSKFAEWKHSAEVSSVLGVAKNYAELKLGRKPTRKELLKEIILLANGNAHSYKDIQRRLDTIGKILNANQRKEARDAQMLEHLDMVLRVIDLAEL